MASFAEVASSIAGPFARTEDVRGALSVLGTEATATLEAIAPERRSALVDRFVRNLRSVGVQESTHVHRLLMNAADASANSDFHMSLTDARAVLAVRNHLKTVLTALGHDWEQLSRVQAAVCGVIRWVQSAGAGEVWITLRERSARFVVSWVKPDEDARLLERSPMIAALRTEVSGFRIVPRAVDLQFHFEIPAR